MGAKRLGLKIEAKRLGRNVLGAKRLVAQTLIRLLQEPFNPVTRKTGKHLMTGKHLKSAGKHYKKLFFVLFYNINNYLKDIK